MPTVAWCAEKLMAEFLTASWTGNMVDDRVVHGEEAVPRVDAPAFSVSQFIFECARVKWYHSRKVTVTRTVTAERVVLALTREPRTTFARILRSSLIHPSVNQKRE